MNRLKMLLVLAAVIVVPLTAQARIKLVALPEREDTIIRLDNPTITLIEEERVLTLQKGINKVDFSWKGVQIDADSIRLAIISHPDKVRLLNVSYPPGENALVWEIASDEPFEEKVRISYLLRYIDRLVTYKAVADKAETMVDLKSYIVLRNFSGEDFDNAIVKLDYGKAFERAIKHEETRQMLFLNLEDTPITKVWKFDSAIQAWDPEKLENQNVGIPVSYRIENKTQVEGLGKFALWGGKVRIFQDDGHDSTIFLGEDNTGLVPVGEKTELYIGDSRDIVVTQRKMIDQKENIRRNNNNQIVLYDNREQILAKIENFKETPAVLTVIQHIPGQWEMKECSMEYKKTDFSTLEFEVKLSPKQKTELKMTYIRKNIMPRLNINPHQVR